LNQVAAPEDGFLDSATFTNWQRISAVAAQAYSITRVGYHKPLIY